MKIGIYYFKTAKSIRNSITSKLISISKDGVISDEHEKRLVMRLLQIYSCRFCGLCFYREEHIFKNESDEILKGLRFSVDRKKNITRFINQ